MVPSIEDIIKDTDFDVVRVQRVDHRRIKSKLEVVEPDPTWPEQFQTLKSRIVSALGPAALVISHFGSTSVPGLPAKDVIDIDLTVPDVNDEAAYVAALEAAGFHYLFYEPEWHGHHFFVAYEPVANLHVWGPGCPETERHRIFRDWLIKTPEDRALYAQTKREAMVASSQAEETVAEYNKRKEKVIREIYYRAFKDLGYVK